MARCSSRTTTTVPFIASLMMLRKSPRRDRSSAHYSATLSRFLLQGRELQLAGQPVKLGWLASSLFIAYGVAAPLWGFAVNRYGARNCTVAALIIWGLTCFWSGVAQSYDMLLASRIVLGAGHSHGPERRSAVE